MRIYLDMCCIQRPLDSKAQIRVAVEAEAVLGILSLVNSRAVEIVSSDALNLEARRNPNAMRRAFALDILAKATVGVETTDDVAERARLFCQAGLKPLDSLHLALAENANADFCTCDDRLRRRAKAFARPIVRVLSPLELIEDIAHDRSE